MTGGPTAPPCGEGAGISDSQTALPLGVEDGSAGPGRPRGSRHVSRDSHACFYFSEKSKSAVHMDDGDYQPQPLTVEVQVQLNQYRSAEEALREMSL